VHLIFELSMPNVGSWNGKWTGESNYYARVVNFSELYGKSKKAKEKADSILAKGYFRYNFGDGWAAGIHVRKADGREAVKARKNSKGFCGYDWMVDSIMGCGEILSTRDREAL
jgi:hypothetical protein